MASETRTAFVTSVTTDLGIDKEITSVVEMLTEEQVEARRQGVIDEMQAGTMKAMEIETSRGWVAVRGDHIVAVALIRVEPA